MQRPHLPLPKYDTQYSCFPNTRKARVLGSIHGNNNPLPLLFPNHPTAIGLTESFFLPVSPPPDHSPIFFFETLESNKTPYTPPLGARLSKPSHHQQKWTLRLIRRRCVLTQATHLLRPMGPVRPDLRCNAPPHPTLPDALWQRSLRPDATWRPPYVWTTPDSFSHLFFLLMRR